MRRQYVGRTDAMVRSAEGEQGFWPSYADMMSAVALILFFLMLLSYISNMITGNNLKNTESQLEETRIQLAAREQELSDLEQALIVTMKQVDDAKADLQQLTVNLDEVKLTLAAKEEDLAAQDKLLQDQKALLSEQEQQLSSQKQQLSSQQEQLSSQQQRITEQEEYLAAATDELLEMRGQMQTIAVLRLSILEQIRDSVVAVMGDASKVRIGENGNIVLSEGVFFDVGSAAVKTAAVPTLNQLIESSPATPTAPVRMTPTVRSPPSAPTPFSAICWKTAAESFSSMPPTSVRPVTAKPAPWPPTTPRKAGRRTAASRSPSS